ncbi:MAG: hypothetical protein RR585_11505 [Coprobacillus sp.]
MEKRLSLKQKDRIARSVYKNYQRAQLDILYLTQHYNYYPQIDLFKVKDAGALYKNGDEAFLQHIERKQQLESFVGIVNQIHTHLSRESYSFIENEYLNFYSSTWWMPYFSRATYYRIKHKALNELMEYAMTFWDEEEILSLLL